MLLQLSLFYILLETVSAVSRPPTLTAEPPKNAVFIINEALKLPCIADADPAPKYEWYKNGRIFNTAARSGRYTVWPGEGTLIFIRPGEDDDGYYQCTAVNDFGVAQSVTTNLRRAEFQQFPPSGAKTKKVSLGSMAILPCSKPTSYPVPEVSWRYQSGGAYINVIPSARTAIGIAGSLVFANVKKEDSDRNYQCVITNKRLNKQQTSPLIRLVVTDQQSEQEHATKIVAGGSPKNNIGVIGEEASFLCLFSGNPTPQITWKFVKDVEIDPMTMPDVRVDTAGVRLLFTKVRQEHAGTYRCQGQNRQSDLVTNEFILTVKSRPKFVNKPQNVMLPPKSEISFDCAANSDPRPTIKWYKNGDVLSSAKRARLVETKLYLYDLKTTDSGVFQCNASNEYGYAFADFYVNVVQEPPTFIHSMKPNTVMAEGQSVTLNCSTYSAPQAIVAWSRQQNNQPLTGGRYNVELNGNLLIKKLQVADSGVYQCTATNPYGKVHTSGRLEIRRRTIITVPPKDVRVYEKSDVKFVCAAETDPLETRNLKISWIKDGTPIDLKQQLRIRPNPPDNSLIIGGVGPLDTGSYICVASNGIDNATASASLVVQGRPNPPKGVQVVCEMSPSKRQATVSWISGSDNSAPILKFEVEFANMKVDSNTWFPVTLVKNDKSGSAKKIISVNPSAVVEMNPGITYRFRVRARNIVGLSDPSNPSTKFCANSDALPSKNPTNLWAEGTQQNNLIVRWTPMSEFDQNGPQLEYLVTVRCLNCDSMTKDKVNTTTVVNWRDNNIEFRNSIRVGETNYNIEVYKLFEVTIMSRNAKGDSTASKVSTNGYSGESFPRLKVSGFGTVGTKSKNIDMNNQMTLKWQAPGDVNTSKEMNGFFRGYRVEWCLNDLTPEKCEQHKLYQDYIVNTPDHPLGMTYGRRRRRSVDDVLHRYRRATINVQQTLDRLPGNATLKAWVRLINKRYAGPPSNIITFTTATGLPGPVAAFAVKTVGVTHFSFSWQKPNQTNGPITAYQMGVQRITDLDLGFMMRFPKIEDPKTTSGDVVGLKPKTQYRVYIWASTSAGFGVPTFLDVKTFPANATPGAPTLVVTPVGETSINVTFAPSARSIAGSVFYAQYRLKGRSKWEETYREFSKRYIEILDLPTDTLYVVRMVATNGAGLTAFSDDVLVRTGGSSAAGLNAASSTWFIIMLCLMLLLIAGIVGLLYLRRYRYDKVVAVPTEDPDVKSGFGYDSGEPKMEPSVAGGYEPQPDAGVTSDLPPKEDFGPPGRHYQNVPVSQHQAPVEEFAEPPRYVDAMRSPGGGSPSSEEEWTRPPTAGRRRVINSRASQERLDGPPGSGSGAAINSGSLVI